MVCAAIIRVIGTKNVEVTHVATHPDHIKHHHCTVLLRAIMDKFSTFNVALITLTSTTAMVSLRLISDNKKSESSKFWFQRQVCRACWVLVLNLLSIYEKQGVVSRTGRVDSSVSPSIEDSRIRRFGAGFDKYPQPFRWYFFYFVCQFSIFKCIFQYIIIYLDICILAENMKNVAPQGFVGSKIERMFCSKGNFANSYL